MTGTSDEVKTMDRLKLLYEVTNLKTLSGNPLPVSIDIANQ
ncbi:hypothetical protein NC99_07670 [Sunxiuqinia dokdonensis]|uniref:Uncharacterized protein n=1 Tax=Sunxiuqinia dokdonensis TaxID=1409788 RepID=A0A0L8VDG8_9BACT|nr:hypothetical protein NC99_07670 [Sunxiuqinia dokdonensis]